MDLDLSDEICSTLITLIAKLSVRKETKLISRRGREFLISLMKFPHQ